MGKKGKHERLDTPPRNLTRISTPPARPRQPHATRLAPADEPRRGRHVLRESRAKGLASYEGSSRSRETRPVIITHQNGLKERSVGWTGRGGRGWRTSRVAGSRRCVASCWALPRCVVQWRAVDAVQMMLLLFVRRSEDTKKLVQKKRKKYCSKISWSTPKQRRVSLRPRTRHGRRARPRRRRRPRAEARGCEATRLRASRSGGGSGGSGSVFGRGTTVWKLARRCGGGILGAPKAQERRRQCR
jgi:hypothetical protein